MNKFPALAVLLCSLIILSSIPGWAQAQQAGEAEGWIIPQRHVNYPLSVEIVNQGGENIQITKIDLCDKHGGIKRKLVLVTKLSSGKGNQVNLPIGAKIKIRYDENGYITQAEEIK